MRAEFLKYLLSKQGQQQVIKDGYLPLTAEMAAAARDAGSVYDKHLVTSAPRLSLLNQDSCVAGDAYTGLRRRKQTPWTVKFGDAFVSRLIAIGGIGTIAAILLVVLVLVGTALPLIRNPAVQSWDEISASSDGTTPAGIPYVHSGVDENGMLLWGMLDWAPSKFA